jgi:hypothetical protein
MVAGAIVHTEWLNENRNRKYPFWDGCSLRDASGSMRVPNELIVDLVFPVHALTYDVSQFYLAELTVFGGGVTISLGYSGTTIATRTITEAEHTENRTYYIEGTGDFVDSVGRIIIGRMENIKDYGGTYSFNVADARLLPTVLRPSLRGVSALRVITADNNISELLQGDIELIAGDNITMTITPGGDPDTKRLKISATTTSDFDEACECPDEAQGEPIKTINGVGPDATGAFFLEGLGCVALDNAAVANGIRITDTCAEPCCGCEELDVLRDEVARLGTQIATQRAFAQRALSAIEQLRDVILSSKFGSVVPCP